VNMKRGPKKLGRAAGPSETKLNPEKGRKLSSVHGFGEAIPP